MIADHRHAAPGSQRGESAGERRPENLQLAIHGDAQGLEGSRRGMDPALVRATSASNRAGDDIAQVGGGHEPALLARRQDRLRDAARMAFFTKCREDSGELSFRGAIDELQGRNTSFFIESTGTNQPTD